MKWLLSFLCFATATAFSQSIRQPLMERLKKTQEQLHGRVIIPEKVEKFTPQSRLNLAPYYSYKKLRYPPIVSPDRKTAVVALGQDNMPCVVPNMEFWNAMPNAGDKLVLKNPIDRDIYLNKPES